MSTENHSKNTRLTLSFLGILAVIALLPFERIGSVELGGLTIRAHQIFALLTLFGWGISVLVRKQHQFRPQPFLIPLVLFVLVNIVSLTNAIHLERSISVLVFTTFTIVLGLVIPQIVTNRKHLERIIIIVVVSSAVVSLFGLFQFVGDIVGLPTIITGLREHYTKAVFGFPRIQSTALEPLYFANYLLLPLGLVIALALGWARPHGQHTLLRPHILILMIILLGLNLILTVSRGGYIAFAAMLLVLSVMYTKKILTPQWLLVIGGSTIVVVFLAFRFLGLGGGAPNIETFRSHVVNLSQGAAYSERVENYEIASRAFSEHPVIGIGPGAFGPYASEHPYVEPRTGWKIVNNEFLEVLAETGLVGFSIFLFFVGFLIVRSVKAYRRAREDDLFIKASLVGLTATWIAIIVQYQTFSILYIMHVWVVFGLLVATQNICICRDSTSTYQI